MNIVKLESSDESKHIGCVIDDIKGAVALIKVNEEYGDILTALNPERALAFFITKKFRCDCYLI